MKNSPKPGGKSAPAKIAKKDFNIILLFPPQWTPQNPHFAILSLAGHLRHKGYRVNLQDLNLEFFDQMLTPEVIQSSLNRILLDYRYLHSRLSLLTLIGEESVDYQLKGAKFLAIEKFLTENQELLEKLPKKILDAKETFRDSRRFYNPLLLVEAFTIIDKALELVSLPYHPARLAFNNFEQPDLLLATYDLIKITQDAERNLFYKFMSQKVSGLLKHNPHYIGISINSFSQVLAGLTLAKMLKAQALPECHINIGGNYFSRVKDALLKRPEFFENFAHSLSLGEGEKQSFLLAEQLRSDQDLSKVPNFLYLDKKHKVKFTFEAEPEKLDKLGFQDLEGLPLKKYFSPDPVLCIQSSKGCYWGKCTFCDTDFGIHQDTKSLKKLVAEIKYLRDKYGVKNFEFIDESIHPTYMRKMAKAFLAEKLDIHWFSNARIETAFTKELLELLQAAGLTMLLWGLEAGSRRVMDLINKGIDFEKRFKILKDSQNAGLWNFAYIFFGFPTESLEEAMDTIRVICDNKELIHSYGRSVFTLGKHSLLYLDKEKYGILEVVEDMEELSSNLSYQSSKGMNDKEVDEMMKLCTKLCSESYDYALWYYLRFRENIHLYLAKMGRDFVEKFKIRKAEKAQLLQTW